jgi:hypothetical protein
MADAPGVLQFADRAGYQAAFGELLAQATGTLDVFDIDLLDCGLSHSQRVAQLSDALVRDPALSIRIALQDAAPLQHRMPRLWSLCGAQSHRIQIRQTPRTLNHLRETFALSAAGQMLIRTHSAHWRGKLCRGDAPGRAAYGQRFNEIWETSSCCISTTKFGL